MEGGFDKLLVGLGEVRDGIGRGVGMIDAGGVVDENEIVVDIVVVATVLSTVVAEVTTGLEDEEAADADEGEALLLVPG